MGRIVVTEFVSLDGVFESPGPAGDFEHAGWTFRFNRGADGDKFKFDEHMAAEAQLLGRVTYEGVRRGVAVGDRRRGLRRPDELDAEVRGLRHAGEGGVA